MARNHKEGVVLACTPTGRIKEVIYDGLNLSEKLPTGVSLTALMNHHNINKALSFLEELRVQKFSFGWELNLQLGHQIKTLHAAGTYINGLLYIVAATSRVEADRLYEEMLKINNEQMNLLRQAKKENMMLRQNRTDEVYDEMTRINNDLVNLQRELSKKNLLLEQQKRELERYRQILAIENAYINEIFGKMVDPRVRDHLLSGNINLGGETQQATILFTDIRGFTAISAQLRPDEVVAWLNLYFEEMSHCIIQNKGLVNKYIGDAILAVFGVPIALENHAEVAVQAALAMRTALTRLNKRFLKQGMPLLKAGIGIHTGPVLAGNIGSSHRMEFTVIGDAVNIASRMENLSKDFTHDIIISEATLAQLTTTNIAAYLATVQVRGTNHNIKIYSVE